MPHSGIQVEVSILISQYIKLTIIVQNFWSLWWTNASKLYAVIWLKGPNKIQLFYPIPTQELSTNWGRGAFLFLDWRPVSHRGVFRLIAGRVHGGDLVERTTILIQILIKIELVSKYHTPNLNQMLESGVSRCRFGTSHRVSDSVASMGGGPRRKSRKESFLTPYCYIAFVTWYI